MEKRAFVRGIEEAYSRYVTENPQVRAEMCKQAGLNPWVAGGLGAIGGVGLGAGAMKLLNAYQARKQQQSQQSEEDQLRDLIMQQYAATPSGYYYG